MAGQDGAADGNPAARKKEAFKALVEAQDQGQSVPESRKTVAEQFGISEDDVRDIEKEGVAKNWPPL